MIYLLFLTIGFAAGYWIAKLNIKDEKSKIGEMSFGLSQREKDKGGNLTKALAMFAEGKEITNAEIQTALGVSDATSTRYLDELERQGIIAQIGKEGRFVKYKLK